MRALRKDELRWVSGGGGYYDSTGTWVEEIIVTGDRPDDTPDYTWEDFLRDNPGWNENNDPGGNDWPEDNGNSGGDTTPAEDTTNEVRLQFIRDHEGGVLNNGYVPKDKNGNVLGQSGVTVGAGVDLGGKTAEQLRGWGVDQSIIDKLEPYMGKKGSAAVDYLAANPLSLTTEEATQLSDKAEDAYIKQVAEKYNAASDFNFYELPAEAQTVIADLAFQYGVNLNTATPNFWTQVTTGDWQGAYDNLRDFGDDYDTRRNDEADLLKEAIDANTLP